MWGYIYFTALYILAKQNFFLDADRFFFFLTQEKGSMRSLLGGCSGARESNTFFFYGLNLKKDNCSQDEHLSIN